MDYYSTHIIGCGNILKGDDGFGPAVIAYLEESYIIPDDFLLEDAGLACTDWLLNLVGDREAPRKIIIIDAHDLDQDIGIIMVKKAIEMEIPDSSISRHLFPDKNVIQILDKAGVELLFVSCQVEKISDELHLGLTKKIKKVVPKAAEIVANLVDLEKID